MNLPLWRRRQKEELEEELRGHLEVAIRERMERGESRADAEAAARREFGNVNLVRETTREMWGWASLDRLMQDVRYGLRQLRRSPSFTLTAVLTLSLGIGANTAIFSLLDEVLFKSLPVDRPDELLALTHISREGNTGSDFSYAAYLDFRNNNQAFAGLFAASRTQQVDLGLVGETDKAQCKVVSDSYFTVLGVRPIVGRGFQPQDDAQPVAVISARFWKRSFNGSDAVLGRQLTIEGVPITIVGVAPPEFLSESVGEIPDLWASIRLETGRRNTPGVTWLYLMGRLKPSHTAAQAAAELSAIVPRSESAFLSRIAVEPGARGFSRLRSRVTAPLRVLMAIVAVVLLIACANLASLLLARAATREREIATRLAIGASRSRIVRQLLTESLLLSLIGGALGILFAWWSSRLVVSLFLAGRTMIELDLRPDLRVLMFTGAVSLFTGVVCGLAPALQAVRRDVVPALKLSAQTLSGRERRGRLKDALIVTQIALSLLLLVVGGLFLGTLRNLKTQDTGFQAENVLLVELRAPWGYRPEWPGLILRLQERMRAIPGVQAASVSLNAPLPEDGAGVYGLKVEGYTPQTSEDQRARADWVGPNYLETVGVPLVDGRDFSPVDNATAPRVAIVNQTMARHYFGARRIVGRQFEFNKAAYEIIGVAKDAKYSDLRAPSPRVVYFAALQGRGRINLLEIRTVGSPLAFAGAVRAAVGEIDSRLRIEQVTTVPRHIDRKLSREYLVAYISSFFGGLTLFLVMIGIHGTLAYRVVQRTNEIGIRMALGAAPASVLRMVLQDTLLWLAAGLMAGVAAVLGCTRALAAFLYGLTPTDSVTVALACVLLVGMALGASYFPARRASRVDPIAALRLE